MISGGRFRFEELTIYQDAQAFRKLCQSANQRLSSFSLKNQIDRATLSVILNIAEGAGRATALDFARFLKLATGSISETVAAFDVACREQSIDQEQFALIYARALTLTKRIHSFRKNLLLKGGG